MEINDFITYRHGGSACKFYIDKVAVIITCENGIVLYYEKDDFFEPYNLKFAKRWEKLSSLPTGLKVNPG